MSSTQKCIYKFQPFHELNVGYNQHLHCIALAIFQPYGTQNLASAALILYLVAAKSVMFTSNISHINVIIIIIIQKVI